MKSKGIRINDSKSISEISILAVSPMDILKFIKNGNEYHWAIIELEVLGSLGFDTSISELEKKITSSQYGVSISWEELTKIAEKFAQTIWATILGCRDIGHIKKYKSDFEMYENCEIVIEVIDGGCCEVFSHNHTFINVLQKSFKETEFLNADWNKKEEIRDK